MRTMRLLVVTVFAVMFGMPAFGAGGASAALFSNPAGSSRENMTVRVTHDAAKTWSPGKVLWPGPAAYSRLAALPDGRCGCLFEAGEESPYESIRFARFTLEQVENQDGQKGH